jgi:hypothetical protein
VTPLGGAACVVVTRLPSIKVVSSEKLPVPRPGPGALDREVSAEHFALMSLPMKISF